MSLARVGVWAALAAGPLALAAFCAMPRPHVVTTQPKATAPAAVRSPDPSGVAALFTDLWLRSTGSDSGAVSVLSQLGPGIELPTRSGAGAAQSLTRTVPVRSAQLSDGSWSVVVAAQFAVRDSGTSADPGSGARTVVRYFAVPVVASDPGGTGAFTVTAAPAEVAAPGRAQVPASPFDYPLPGDSSLVLSVSEFFTAYLTGVGEVDRYLSPGTVLSHVSGSGYRSVVVDQAAAEAATKNGSVPEDGTVARVQVHVTATDTAGDRWPLAYSLTTTARSGRWEITALQAGATPPSTHRATPPPEEARGDGSTDRGGAR